MVGGLCPGGLIHPGTGRLALEAPASRLLSIQSSLRSRAGRLRNITPSLGTAGRCPLRIKAPLRGGGGRLLRITLLGTGARLLGIKEALLALLEGVSVGFFSKLPNRLLSGKAILAGIFIDRL